LIFWLNQKHGLNSFLFELLILGLWPVGWLAGKIAVAVLALIH
jgi:hypothetical protein